MATPSSSARRFSDRGSLFRKKLNSDDHFDRPFSFMAVKGNYETKKKEITSTTIRASKKITTSYVRKEEQ